jgi:hypothetical protein
VPTVFPPLQFLQAAMSSGGRKEAYRPHMRQGVDGLAWRDDFGGRGGNGFQPAIALTQSRAAALSLIPVKCRRHSITADSSPLSSNT